MLRGLLGGFARGRRQTSAATLVLDFLAGLNDSRITYSGGTNGTRVNSSGVIVAATTPRFDYDPVTLAARGLLIEESRTNSIRNNTMQGAAAGSPGTPPTNWNILANVGLTQTILGTGSENGVDYIDVRFAGTPSGSSYLNITPDLTVSAAAGQTWTGSFFAKLLAGSFGNSAPFIEVRESTGADTFLTNTLSTTSLNSSLARFQLTRTLTDASTALVSVRAVYQYTNGLPIDFTVRLGLPQLELGAFATSVIPTTTAAVTRTADSAVMTGTNFSSWYNQSEGTFVVSATAAPAIGVVAQATLEIDDTTVNNRHVLFRDGSGFINAQTGVGGVVQSSLVGAAWPSSTLGKQAFSYQVNDFAMSFNAATPITDAAGSVPTVTQMVIGNTAPGNRNFGGHIRSITYYPTARPNSLQALTA